MHQKIIIIGNAGKDPETRNLESGQSVTTITVATNETYKDKSGEKKTDTEWHNVVLWRGLSEIASKYVKKGDLIYIEGKLKTRSWDDKDGKKQYRTEVIADVLRMLGGNSKPEAVKGEEPQTETESAGNDDLPF